MAATAGGPTTTQATPRLKGCPGGAAAAAVDGEAVRVEWTTSSERDASHFMVERSADGRSFQPMGVVEAAGNSSVQVDYAWNDDAPLRGVSYYRLISLDLDGDAETSNALPVEFGMRTAWLDVHPNPASDQVSIGTPRWFQGAYELRLYDGTGRSVRTLHGSLEIGQGRYVTVPLTGLDAGCYHVALYSGAGALTGTARIIVDEALSTASGH